MAFCYVLAWQLVQKFKLPIHNRERNLTVEEELCTYNSMWTEPWPNALAIIFDRYKVPKCLVLECQLINASWVTKCQLLNVQCPIVCHLNVQFPKVVYQIARVQLPSAQMFIVQILPMWNSPLFNCPVPKCLTASCQQEAATLFSVNIPLLMNRPKWSSGRREKSFWIVNKQKEKNYLYKNGWAESFVVLSAPTILKTQVWISST